MTPLDDKLAELRKRFVARAGEELSDLDAALAAGDREQVVERAHKLAGISGMFGFGDLGRAALELEEAALAGRDWHGHGERVRKLLATLANS